MELKTRPNQWLHDNGGKTWAKMVRTREHLDLSRNGGYTFNCPWLDFTKEAMLLPGYFLLVASEYPSETVGEATWVYKYVLVEVGPNGLREVSEQDLFSVTYAALDKGNVIPEAKCGNAIGNWLYMAAVYCWMSFDRPAVVPVTAAEAALAERRPRRRIGLLGVKKFSEPAAKPVPQAGPPKLPPPPRIPPGLRLKRLPTPSEPVEEVDHIDCEDPFEEPPSAGEVNDAAEDGFDPGFFGSELH